MKILNINIGSLNVGFFFKCNFCEYSDSVIHSTCTEDK